MPVVDCLIIWGGVATFGGFLTGKVATFEVIFLSICLILRKSFISSDLARIPTTRKRKTYRHSWTPDYSYRPTPWKKSSSFPYTISSPRPIPTQSPCDSYSNLQQFASITLSSVSNVLTMTFCSGLWWKAFRGFTRMISWTVGMMGEAFI